MWITKYPHSSTQSSLGILPRMVYCQCQWLPSKARQKPLLLNTLRILVVKHGEIKLYSLKSFIHTSQLSWFWNVLPCYQFYLTTTSENYNNCFSDILVVILVYGSCLKIYAYLCNSGMKSGINQRLLAWILSSLHKMEHILGIIVES